MAVKLNWAFGTAKAPSTVAGVPLRAGYLSPAQLAVIDRQNDIRFNMVPICAEAMRYAHVAAMANHGLALSSTGRYRTWAQQTGEFRVRWSTTKQKWNDGTYVTTTFEGQTWYLRAGYDRIGAPRADGVGIPHCLGIADDMCRGDGRSFNDTELNQLFALMPVFGFKWQATTKTDPERWHVQWVAGDDIPPGVAFFRAEAVKVAASMPSRPIIGMGSVGPLVRVVQQYLKDTADESIKVDGQWGPATQGVWDRYARWCGLDNDGRVNAGDWDNIAWNMHTWEPLYAAGFPRP